MVRWLAVIVALAACESSERAAPRPPPEPTIAATARPADAARPPADAAPAPEDAAAGPDAHVERGVMVGDSKKRIDVVTSRDLLPDLSKYKGLERGSGYGVGDDTGTGAPKGSGSSGGGVAGKVGFGASAGDYTNLTREEVDRVVKSRAGMLKACYQRELAKDKDLAGKLTIQFTIDADGTVTKASVVAASTTLKNTAVQDCVKRQIMKLKFPAKGGAIVKYPFIFSNA